MKEICKQIPEALNLPLESAATFVARRVNAKFGRTTSPKWVEDYFTGKRRPSVSVLEKILDAAELSITLKKEKNDK